MKVKFRKNAKNVLFIIFKAKEKCKQTLFKNSIGREHNCSSLTAISSLGRSFTKCVQAKINKKSKKLRIKK